MNDVDSALAVADLGKIYPSSGQAQGGLFPTSFRLKSGSFFTLLGPSGCGKTTTLRCIAGLEQPDQGSIRLGSDVMYDAATGANVPLNRRNIGMVFQSYAIWPHMTVFENVAFPLRVSRDKRYAESEIKKMVGEALEIVNLQGYEQRSATQLSGGQQQRVALARAIVRRPRLLLLDEPLSNLDALLRAEMRAELKRLQRQLAVTTVYVTHDQAEALEMSDEIAVLNRGRLVQMGSPREIYLRPRDAFVAGFMGSTNLLRATLRESAAADGVAAVLLADGRTITCRFPHPVSQGEPIAVSVRPDIISLKPAGTAARAGWNSLQGVIVTSGFLGHMNRYSIKVGELMLEATTTPETDFADGASVAVEFSHDAAAGLAAPDAT